MYIPGDCTDMFTGVRMMKSYTNHLECLSEPLVGTNQKVDYMNGMFGTQHRLMRQMV